MAPYIAALVILIVVVLFMVYKRVDGFEISAVSINGKTPLKDVLNIYFKLIQTNRNMKSTLDASQEFDDETITETKLKELGIPFNKIGTTLNVEKPISKTLLRTVTNELTTLSNSLNTYQNGLQSGSVKDTTTLSDANRALSLPVTDDLSTTTLFNTLVRIANARERYVNAKARFTPTAPTTPTETTTSTTTAASTGTTVGGVTMSDLFGAVAGVSGATPSTTSDASGNTPDTTVMEAAPQPSFLATQEMETRIAKSVAKELKDTLLSQRSTQNPIEDISCPYASFDSSMTTQGQEYRQAKPAPSAAPDMSEYIRKDSIPCWNCSLPN